MEKVVVVTGGNRGLGFEIAKDVRARGHAVVLVSRCADRGAEAKRTIEAACAGPPVRVVKGDLGSLDGALATGHALAEACAKIDVLVHNAGLWPSERRLDGRGFEEAFVVNHLAPFVLNHLLAPRLEASGGRVVLVTAGLYVAGRPTVERTPSGADFHAFRTYPSTKACALALVPRFGELLGARGITLNAVHPGVFRTGLGDRSGVLGAALSLVKMLWKSPSRGAQSVTRLAIDDAFEGVSRKLYLEYEEAELAAPANDLALAEALYTHAVRVTGLGA